MSDSVEFEKDEKVLCFHGPMLYEAKILKLELWTNRPDLLEGTFYFVHYRGWKQSWDEWVPNTRLRKLNAVNLALQQELRNTVVPTKEKPLKIEKRPELVKKRARNESHEKEDEFLKRPEVKIIMPEELKTQLVEDWESVTKNHKLVILPRVITVNDVLKRFHDHIKEGMKRRGGREGFDFHYYRRSDDSLNEVVSGIKIYFDRALGNTLLYRFERQQYVDIKSQYPDKSMSDVYGPEHLLRLFVQFPSLIAHTNMDQDSINILKDHLTQFLAYLLKFQKEIFLDDYESATSQYVALHNSA